MQTPINQNRRPFTLWQVLALNPTTLRQLVVGVTMAMLALSLMLSGAPVGGILMAGASAIVLLWGGHNTLYLMQHDLPLLRGGTLVAARVAGVVKQTNETLYRITYRPPGELTERMGIFVAANDSQFEDGEPVAIMIDPYNPAQLVEVSGRYERLFEKKKRAA